MGFTVVAFSPPPAVGQEDFLPCEEREAALGGLDHQSSVTLDHKSSVLGALAVPQLPHLWSNIHSADKMGGILG